MDKWEMWLCGIWVTGIIAGELSKLIYHGNGVLGTLIASTLFCVVMSAFAIRDHYRLKEINSIIDKAGD